MHSAKCERDFLGVPTCTVCILPLCGSINHSEVWKNCVNLGIIAMHCTIFIGARIFIFPANYLLKSWVTTNLRNSPKLTFCIRNIWQRPKGFIKMCLWLNKLANNSHPNIILCQEDDKKIRFLLHVEINLHFYKESVRIKRLYARHMKPFKVLTW